MKWTKKITSILGKFWTTLFDDSDFILGVQNLYVFWGRLQEAVYHNWRSGLTPAVNDVRQDSYPFLILIDVNSIHPTHYTYADVLNGVGALGAEKPNTGWFAECKDVIPHPDMITEHIMGAGRTLFAGLDYRYYNKEFVFYTDPRSLGLPVIKMTAKDGTLKEYLRLFGRTVRKVNSYDAIVGFGSASLNAHASVCWDMHQNGATAYNTKKLLGEITDSVIAPENGVIDHLWTENDYNFMLINNKVYGSKKLPNFAHGDDVKTGDVLFGSLQYYTAKDSPANAEVPGILVQTDAGEMLAANTNLTAYTEQGIHILPLTVNHVDGDTSTRVSDYKRICYRNAMDVKCPQIDIPSTVNPYQFVMKTLRRGRSVCVRLIAEDLHKLGAAIQWLRKCTCTSGNVTVFVKAESDGMIPVSGFTAYAGMTAIAVDASVTIKEACAEARIMI